MKALELLENAQEMTLRIDGAKEAKESERRVGPKDCRVRDTKE